LPRLALTRLTKIEDRLTHGVREPATRHLQRYVNFATGHGSKRPKLHFFMVRRNKAEAGFSISA
jgi:hypothetical protein